MTKARMGQSDPFAPGGGGWAEIIRRRTAKFRPIHWALGLIVLLLFFLVLAVGAVAFLFTRPGEQVMKMLAQATAKELAHFGLPAAGSAGKAPPVSAMTEGRPPRATPAPSPAVSPELRPEQSELERHGRTRQARLAGRGPQRRGHGSIDNPSSQASRAGGKDLTPQEIVAAFKEKSGSLMPCLQQAQTQGEIAPGTYKLMLDWTILPDGSVSESRLTGPPNAMGTSLPGCLAAKIRKWRFPPSRAGAPVKNFPFGPFTIR